MEQGHGLLDRFLVTIPLALRPTPEQLDEASERLNEMAFDDMQLLFDAIIAAHINIVVVYQLDEHWNLRLYGNYIKVRVPRSAKQVAVLVKKTPTVWPDDALCSQEDFNEKKNAPANALITANISQALSSRMVQ